MEMSSWQLHMGQFPQDGENGQNVAFFIFFWSSAVTKRFDFFNFSQLFWKDFDRGILKNVLVLVLAHLEHELELDGTKSFQRSPTNKKSSLYLHFESSLSTKKLRLDWSLWPVINYQSGRWGGSNILEPGSNILEPLNFIFKILGRIEEGELW